MWRALKFILLQFISFGMLMSATRGEKQDLFILPIACFISMFSYYSLFKKKKGYN